ncbi:hypothetical protein ACT3UQ_08725 [Glutamicibacter sp. AOP12-B1-11]|uniref:hypothetical protein n=1 Tax=Glutamicibacter sp. AOP12-B1-11 TaxID=3457725 RepID=UPI0040333688
MGNVEVLLVDFLNQSPRLQAESLEASLDVPNVRPKRFITVERTGGPENWITGTPTLAVQIWATHRYEAGDLAQIVAEVARTAVSLPTVARVIVSSVYNFPDPDSKQARYQIVVELVTKFD